MSTDLQSEPRRRTSSPASRKVFALICTYLLLAIAVGVTRGVLQDVSGNHTLAASGYASKAMTR
jgi:hypothetical protein